MSSEGLHDHGQSPRETSWAFSDEGRDTPPSIEDLSGLPGSLFAVSGHYRQLQAPLSDLPKEVQLFRIQGQLPDQLPGMMHDAAGHLDQLPAKGGEGVMPPGLRTAQALEPEEEPVRQAHG